MVCVLHPRRTVRSALLVGLGTLLLAGLGGCGGEASSGGLSLTFDLSRGDDPVACSEVSEVREVTLRIRDAQGQLVSGVPTRADCATGAVEVPSLADGTYTVELTATGDLAGDPGATLFSATQEVTSPGGAAITLMPRVAFLSLGWTFGQDDLLPCGAEVEAVSVIVSTGAGTVGSYSGTFGCTETPVVIPQPFDLQEYTIQVEANSAEGFPLFTHTASRLLDRGANTYTAVLTPLGGQIFVDWAFAVRPDDMPVRMCDAPSVQVDELTITIESLEGGVTVSDTVACTEPMRPFAFTKARFTQGRRLALTLSADGAQRFEAYQEFVMPDGDRVGDRSTLFAVGTATVAVEVETATCAPASTTGFAIEATLVDVDAEQTVSVEIGPADRSAALDGLWFGEWDVEAAVITPQGRQCARTVRRTVSQRQNAWDPVVF